MTNARILAGQLDLITVSFASRWVNGPLNGGVP